MKMVVQGSRNFNDYSIFLNAMGKAMAMMQEGDSEFFIYSVGPAQINSMGMEFSNISERSLKARGIKIRLFKVPASWVKSNIHEISYFAFFNKPKEPTSALVDFAEDKDVEVGIYRY